MFFRKAPAPRGKPADRSTEIAPPVVADRGIVLPVPQPPEPLDESGVLVLSLEAMAKSWPDSVRTEIEGLNGADLKLAMPTEIAERALKRGRLVFPWKTVRAWIRPIVPPTVSTDDDLTLELPLIAVAPLFLASQRGRHRAKPAATIDEEIPNLFPEPAKQTVPAETRRQPKAGIVWWNPDQDQPPAAPLAEAAMEEPVAAPSVPSSPILNSSAEEAIIGNRTDDEPRSAPENVILRCTQLEGITGALIASSEGFVVADQLPSGLNPDTVAAFVPQIFRKMSQSTRELRVGELSSVSLSFDNRSWQIFHSRDMFLAMVGAPGQPVSTDLVAELVSELEKPN